jgi:hypothetical protein
MSADVTSVTANNKKRIVLVVSCVGMFLAVLRSTSANTILTDIRADLGGAVAGLQSRLWGATHWC